MKKIFAVVAMLICLTSVSLVYGYSGTATLKWTPPTTFTDGTPLVPATDISSFKIYSGTASGVYGAPIVVTGGTTTTYTMTIGTGTTYFALSVVGINGLESVKSAEVSKTITAPAPGGCSLTVQ
jgi:hypothetical protein